MEAEDLVEQLDRFDVDTGTVLGAAKIMLDRLEPGEATAAVIGWMQSFGLTSFIPTTVPLPSGAVQTNVTSVSGFAGEANG